MTAGAATRRGALGVALAGVVAVAAPARADTTVGVLDVRGDGDLTDVVVERFAEAVEEGLGGSRDEIDLVGRAQMLQHLADTTWTPACTAGPCLAEIAGVGVDQVLIAAVSASGQTYRFTLSLVDPRTGRVVRQASEACVACTVDDLASSATIATIALMNEAGETIVVGEDGRVAALEGRVRRHARSVRRTGVLLLAAAAVGAGVSSYFLRKDEDVVGYPVAGAAAGLAVSGAIMVGLSLRF